MINCQLKKLAYLSVKYFPFLTPYQRKHITRLTIRTQLYIRSLFKWKENGENVHKPKF